MKEPRTAARESPPAIGPDLLGQLLRKLRPIEEKVVRLSYGFGCQRAHGVEEIAQEFGVARELVVEILEEAERRLAQEGIARSQLQEASRQVRGRRCKPRPRR